MTLLLAILAGMWALFLVPPMVRSRQERTSDSISSFRHHLSSLERTRADVVGSQPFHLQPRGQASPALPSDRAEARRRRRDVLFTLTGAVAITLLLALLLGGVAVLFHLLADAMLGGYLYLLVQMRRADSERAAKVRFMHQPAVSAEPAVLLQRTASQ